MKDLRSQLEACGFKESAESAAIEKKLERWHPELKPAVREMLEIERRTGIRMVVHIFDQLRCAAALTVEEKKKALETIRDAWKRTLK